MTICFHYGFCFFYRLKTRINDKVIAVNVLIHGFKRFVLTPASDLNNKLGKQVKELGTDIENLGKRLHYLETTAKNSQSHIDQILKRGDA